MVVDINDQQYSIYVCVCVLFLRRYKVQEWDPSISTVHLVVTWYLGASFSKHYGVLGLQGFVCKYVWSILISWFFASCWQVMIIIQWTTWILEEGKKMLNSLSLRVNLTFSFLKIQLYVGIRQKYAIYVVCYFSFPKCLWKSLLHYVIINIILMSRFINRAVI